MPKNGASDFIKVDLLLCRIDTCFSFWFIESVIGVWIADLFREISSTTKLIGWVENSVETCPSNAILVLENMSGGHISILGNTKKTMLQV